MVTGFQMQLPPKHINTGNPSKKKWGEVFHGLAKNNGSCQGTEPKKENYISSKKARSGREVRRPCLPWPGSMCQPSPPAISGTWRVTAHHHGAALILEFCWDFVVLISVELDILRAFKPFLFWREFHYDSICSPGQGLTLGGMGRLWGLCGSHPLLLSPPSPLLFAFSLCCSSCSALSRPPTWVGSADQEIPLLPKACLEVSCEKLSHDQRRYFSVTSAWLFFFLR